MDSLVRFSEINQSKPFEFHLKLSNQKVSELIKRLDVLNIKKVSLVGSLSPLSIDEWSLKAELKATVKQKCVISFKIANLKSKKNNRGGITKCCYSA